MLGKRAKFLLLLALLMVAASCQQQSIRNNEPSHQESNQQQEGIAPIERPYKILYIMSYHSPWEWTDVQLKGFQEAMGEHPAEYKVFQMDAKNNSSTEWLIQKGEEARQLIEEWKPDLVYTSDDEALKYVVSYFAGDQRPFVFSGVNHSLAKYGLEAAPNVTGALEIEHSFENLRMLVEIVPDVRKIAAVFDDSPIWDPVIERLEQQVKKFPNLELTYLERIQTFDEYKERMDHYQTAVDAVALIGIFNFKGTDGNNVFYKDVLKWTAENSQLPDFSYWKDRANHGTLSTVTVSGYAQGYQAGDYARQILIQGVSPSDLPPVATTKSEAIISLARANKLGLKVKSSLLLDSQVYTKFEWEK